MSMPRYHWTRFWSGPADTIQLDELACLVDPEGPAGHALNPHVVSIDAIAHLPCLVLLGEPGSGKTSALESYAAGLRPPPPQTDVHFFNLTDYGSEDRLFRDIFDAPWWTAWREGESTLILVVDSLDEGLLRVATLARVLASGLATGPVARLRFQIACRTADWPASLEKQLRTLFGAEGVGIYELAPLRERDVRLAAEVEDIDANQFIRELHDKGVGPLAARPITLGLLFQAFKRHGGALPRSQRELYEQGCLALCGEPDPERREMGRRHPHLAGVLTPGRRLVVASRIAAAMLVGNRRAVVVDDALDVADSDTALDDLAGGQEADGDERFVVNGRALRETLGTGLFTARGGGRLGWAHQTYAEALAARYLSQADFSQIRSLLVAVDDPSGHLVPQLRELAAWLASMRMDVFDHIAASEPEALMRGDIGHVDDAYKDRLVAALLKRFIAGDLLDTLELRSTYKKLCHPHLAAQLEPVITDRTLGVIHRRVAIDVAEDCSRTELLPQLLAVTVDATENHAVRVQAGHAIARIGDDATKSRLEPLASGALGEDPDDDLRGIALSCLWPRLLPVERLAPCLTQPKQHEYIGQYHLFLVQHLIKDAADNDLPQLLSTAQTWTGPQLQHLSPLGTVANQLVRRAWEASDAASVRRAFAELITVYVRRHDHFELAEETTDSLRADIARNREKRRALLATILNETDIQAEECSGLYFAWMPVLHEDDAMWVLAGVEQAPPDRQAAWARCLGLLARGTRSAELVDGALVGSARLPALAAEFAWLVEIWDLDSERAAAARANYRRWRELEAQPRRAPVLLDPSPAERIRLDLDESDRGEAGGWIGLTRDLTLEPTSTQYAWDFTTDLTSTPGWKSADQGLQNRIREAARAYILRHALEDDEWMTTDSVPYGVVAGYQAWRLLLADHGFRETTPTEIWEAWAATLIGYPGQGHPWHRVIICLTYSAAPVAALRYLSVLIDREDRRHGDVFCLRDFEACWDDQLDSLVLHRLRARPIAEGSFLTLADLLLSREPLDTVPYLLEIIEPDSPTANARELAPIAFALLLDYGGDRDWPALSTFLDREPDLASQGLARLARARALRFKHLSEAALAELYLRLSRRFPPATDPDVDGWHTPSDREKLSDVRSAALTALVSRATPTACDAIRQIIPELPDQHPWLTWQLREAEINARRADWRPPSVSSVIGLLQDRHRRYINSSDELVAVLIESLGRLQHELTGIELPSVVDLWSFQGGGTRREGARPKDEEHLSDYIARWLRRDLGPPRGIVVNREVQPRRGQATDIHVTAVNPTGQQDAISVIIEVKGCWNPDLRTAMRSQLVDRYLRLNSLRHGLYVAGWYLCTGWADDDGRKRQTRVLTPDAVRAELRAQSEEMKHLGFSVTPVVLDLALPAT